MGVTARVNELQEGRSSRRLGVALRRVGAEALTQIGNGKPSIAGKKRRRGDLKKETRQSSGEVRRLGGARGARR